MLNSIGAETVTSRAGKEDSRAIRTLFPDPRRQHSNGGFGQRSTSLLAPFSFTTDMRACGEADILRSNRSGLGKPQTGLNDGQQERMIAAAQPFTAVRSGQQRVDLRSREKAYQGRGCRLLGITSTRWISPECCGVSSAAYRKNDRIAVKRRLRLRAPFARVLSK